MVASGHATAATARSKQVLLSVDKTVPSPDVAGAFSDRFSRQPEGKAGFSQAFQATVFEDRCITQIDGIGNVEKEDVQTPEADSDSTMGADVPV